MSVVLILLHVLFFVNQEDKLQEMFAKTDKSEIKSGIACIRFLLINAARYHTDEATFSAELQQLGLPKEHSVALCRVYFASNVIKYLEDNNFTGFLNFRHTVFFDTYIRGCTGQELFTLDSLRNNYFHADPYTKLLTFFIT